MKCPNCNRPGARLTSHHYCPRCWHRWRTHEDPALIIFGAAALAFVLGLLPYLIHILKGGLP